MPAALVTGAAAVGGALISADSSRNAAETVQNSTDQQTALYERIYDETVDRQEPFYQTGVAANAAAAQLLGLGSPSTQNNRGQANISQGYQTYLNGQGSSPFGFSSSAYGRPESNALGDMRTASGGSTYNNRGQVNPLALNANGNSNPSIIANGDGTYGSTVGGSIGAQTVNPSNPLATNIQTPTNALTSNGQPVYQNDQLTALQQSPGYQFRMQEGMNQLETGAAARGGLLSGQHIKNATQYAQDYASNEYNTRLNQLNTLSGAGQTSANATQSAASNYASGVNNALSTNANYAAYQQQNRESIYRDTIGGVGGLVIDHGKENWGW